MKAREKALAIAPNSAGDAFFLVFALRGGRVSIKLPRRALRRLVHDANAALVRTKQKPMFEEEIKDDAILEEESASKAAGDHGQVAVGNAPGDDSV